MANLSEANLSKAILSSANLSEAILCLANLSETDLSDANLRSANLSEAKLNDANLTEADLSGAKLVKASLTSAGLVDANLTNADLTGAWLLEAIFVGANLTGANLTLATLDRSDLASANLSGAKLIKTDLRDSRLVGANLKNATLEACWIYGVSAWDVNVEGASQKNLIISPPDQSEISVDDLELAQFIYLLLNNAKIRNFIDIITSKAILLLGRFTEERKVVLNAMRDALREHGYVPILFDFEKPSSKDLTETVRTLASLSRFIIADLTDARSIPQELTAIIPVMPSLPVQPIILSEQNTWAMYEGLERYPWVLPLHKYESQEKLIQELSEKVIQPAEQKADEQRPKPLS